LLFISLPLVFSFSRSLSTISSPTNIYADDITPPLFSFSAEAFIEKVLQVTSLALQSPRRFFSRQAHHFSSEQNFSPPRWPVDTLFRRVIIAFASGRLQKVTAIQYHYHFLPLHYHQY